MIHVLAAAGQILITPHKVMPQMQSFSTATDAAQGHSLRRYSFGGIIILALPKAVVYRRSVVWILQLSTNSNRDASSELTKPLIFKMVFKAKSARPGLSAVQLLLLGQKLSERREKGQIHQERDTKSVLTMLCCLYLDSQQLNILTQTAEGFSLVYGAVNT